LAKLASETSRAASAQHKGVRNMVVTPVSRILSLALNPDSGKGWRTGEKKGRLKGTLFRPRLLSRVQTL
jgi:hypothetical protein